MSQVSKRSLLISAIIIALGAIFIIKFILPIMGDHTPNHQEQQFQEGDIIFQTSLSAQSKAIQLATNSKYSHVGILFMDKGDWYVFEAIQPVKSTPLKQWIDRGKDKYYVVKRLKNADGILKPEVLQQMKKEGEKYKGKNYDLYFEWSDERMYCSELVWKIYKNAANIEIGHLQKLSEFNLDDKLVRQKLQERYGENIPLNEMVISPAAMFNSKLIETIYETTMQIQSIKMHTGQ